MGRHYPDIHADPVKQGGYYYSKRYNKLARLRPGDRLPRHMGPWEFVASEGEGTSSEILSRLRTLHPGLDPYRLTFTTSTPVDASHLAQRRNLRLFGYAALAVGALALGVWVARRLSASARA
jgi:hypothetical protein